MADSKLTALTETTTPAANDVLYIVTDTGGTPTSKKIKYSNLATGGGTVDSVVAGTNVSVDNTDPQNPIVSATDTTDHAALSNLSWVDSGHTGTAKRVAAFGAGGAAELAQTTGNNAKLVSGTEGTNGNLVEWDANGDAVDSGIAASDVLTAIPAEEEIVGTAIYDATLTGTENLDLSTFTALYGILTGNTTITVTNTPASGESFVRSLKIVSTATESLTLPVGWNVTGTYSADTTVNDIQIEFSNFPTVGLIVKAYINQFS
jgi:hypothetical protein